MPANLLGIVQAFTRRTGLPQPSAVVGVSQAEVRQVVALLEEVGEELVSRFNWQSLKKKASWTSVATSLQGTLAELIGTEYFERIIPNTFYNETQREPFVGPITLEEWQAYSAGTTPSPNNIFTIVENELLLWPVPAAGETLSFYWQDRRWILGSDGTPKDAFTSDEDTSVFDDTLLRLGLRYKWKMEKGLPYAEDMRAFEAAAMDKSARGMLQPTLHMAGGSVGPRPAILVPLNSTIPTS